ncbi:SRPBCC domain-containing protein [Paenibacillus sp. FSL H7-0331]|uniref:SRPBCC family protein n=1 Tax=Paenibacillus sp. FSL H7-0331 TaxID=1920421 RepID=UPI00096D2329|nr:SRPBCC domain-containing protein [Paenibacillus sp. FSL H7-0331]OME93341.1 ATPase [Paenibacillus sp. FSL H7-0331]
MTNQQPSNSAAPLVKEREFVMERVFHAPRTLVFKAFTQPEHVAKWWAPRPFTIPVCNIDLRVGGKWHYCMQSPEGERHWALAIYQEISSPDSLAYTATFADELANPTNEIPEQYATVVFNEAEGSTKLSITFRFESAEALQAALQMGMIEGLSMTLDNNLPELLAEMQS